MTVLRIVLTLILITAFGARGFRLVPRKGQLHNICSKHCSNLECKATKIPIETDKVPFVLLLEKGLDTLEDAALHFQRLARSKLGITRTLNKKRPTVVLVGYGWGSHAFSKIIDTDLYDVTCISPRPYFVFTPMLPACSVGEVEYRSIIEPVRAANPEIDFIEGSVMDIDPDSNTITATPFEGTSNVTISYDYLVYGVGADVGDFGLPGVRKYCHFIKEIQDARRLKKKILQNFEAASLPDTPEPVKQKLLHFVIVGGGPTGVEFAGDLSDLVKNEAANIYPKLKKYVKISLINSGSSVLQTFDAVLQDHALNTLRQSGIDVVLQARVAKVEDGLLAYKLKNSVEATGQKAPTAPQQQQQQQQQWPSEYNEMEFGLCVWAAGTAARPITKLLASKISPQQELSVAKAGRLKIDPWLRVVRDESQSITQDLGSSGSPAAAVAVTAGRTSSSSSSSSSNNARVDSGDVMGDTEVTYGDLIVGEAVAGKATPNPIFAIGDCAGEVLLLTKENITTTIPTVSAATKTSSAATTAVATVQTSYKQYKYKPSGYFLPQTGQVAAQQGAYTARTLNRLYDLNGAAPPRMRSDANFFSWYFKALKLDKAPQFHFLNLGILASIGSSEAVAEVNLGDAQLAKASGQKAYLLWQSIYIVKQVSLRTRVLVLFDIIKSKIFGKDVTIV